MAVSIAIVDDGGHLLLLHRLDERVLERFLDDYEITPTHAMLVKRLR